MCPHESQNRANTCKTPQKAGLRNYKLEQEDAKKNKSVQNFWVGP